MNKEKSLLYALKQIQTIINLVLDKNEPLDALEPNYGRSNNEEGSSNRQTAESEGASCKVCD
tara:strand:- start:410 stop:595 length:186 start_codon:yes stop_codon:yes gene_type:complete